MLQLLPFVAGGDDDALVERFRDIDVDDELAFERAAAPALTDRLT